MVVYNLSRICERSEAISSDTLKGLLRHPDTSVGIPRKFGIKLLSILLFAILVHIPAKAQSDWVYLVIPQGAHQSAMGETGVSYASNGSGVWWNPAHISRSNTGMWLQTFRWIADGKGSFGGFTIPTSWGGYSAYYVNHGMDGFEARDTPGESEGEFTLRQAVLAGGIAFNMSDNVALGIVYKQAIEIIQGSRASRDNILDLGLSWQRGNYSVGLSAVNVVLDEKDDESLPLTIRSGLSYTHSIDDYNIILAYGGDLERSHLLESKDEFDLIHKLGLEVGWSKMLFGRLGFISGYDSRNLTYGVGVIVKDNYHFDFAVVPTENDLGTTWKMGLGIVF